MDKNLPGFLFNIEHSVFTVFQTSLLAVNPAIRQNSIKPNIQNVICYKDFMHDLSNAFDWFKCWVLLRVFLNVKSSLWRPFKNVSVFWHLRGISYSCCQERCARGSVCQCFLNVFASVALNLYIAKSWFLCILPPLIENRKYWKIF